MCVCSLTVLLRNKLRVVLLSLSSLCMTRKKTSQKKKKKSWPHDILGARSTWNECFSTLGFLGCHFFPQGFFTVMFDRLSKRGTTRSLA